MICSIQGGQRSYAMDCAALCCAVRLRYQTLVPALTAAFPRLTRCASDDADLLHEQGGVRDAHKGDAIATPEVEHRVAVRDACIGLQHSLRRR